jgi:membrane protein
MRATLGYAVAVWRRSLARFIELEGVDRAMALAGQAFAALLPLLIVVGAASPSTGRDVAGTLIRRLHLDDGAAEAVRDAIAQPDEVPGAVSTFGILLLVVSALSFTRALQRLYVRAWRLPSLGLYGNGWGLAWLAAFSAFWCAQPGIVALFDGALGAVVALALSGCMWLFTPWILVGRRLAWHTLLPQALLTSLGLTALGGASAIYMPHALESAAVQFGFIGVAVTLLSWLFGVALVLVATAALGASLVQTDDPAQ